MKEIEFPQPLTYKPKLRSFYYIGFPSGVTEARWQDLPCDMKRLNALMLYANSDGAEQRIAYDLQEATKKTIPEYIRQLKTPQKLANGRWIYAATILKNIDWSKEDLKFWRSEPVLVLPVKPTVVIGEKSYSWSAFLKEGHGLDYTFSVRFSKNADKYRVFTGSTKYFGSGVYGKFDDAKQHADVLNCLLVAS